MRTEEPSELKRHCCPMPDDHRLLYEHSNICQKLKRKPCGFCVLPYKHLRVLVTITIPECERAHTHTQTYREDVEPLRPGMHNMIACMYVYIDTERTGLDRPPQFRTQLDEKQFENIFICRKEQDDQFVIWLFCNENVYFYWISL